MTVACALIASCRDPASGNDDLTAFQPVSDLRTWSANDSTVGLQWVHSPNVLSFDAKEYTIEVWDGRFLVETRSVPLSTTSALISPLTAGRLYRFDIYLRAVDEPKDFRSGLPVSVLWATASRFVYVGGTLTPIRIPAVSTARRIGLQLYDSSSGGPMLRDGSLNEGLQIDVFFDAVLPAVRTGEEMGPPFPGTSTRFSTMAPIIAATADEPLSFPPAVDSYTLTQIPCPRGSLGAGLILFGRSGSGHTFRLFLRPDDNGALIHGADPDAYIEIEVSYQTSITLGIATAYEN